MGCLPPSTVAGAWRRGYTGRGVVVSVLGDGIEPHHPALEPNYVRVPEEGGRRPGFSPNQRPRIFWAELCLFLGGGKGLAKPARIIGSDAEGPVQSAEVDAEDAHGDTAGLSPCLSDPGSARQRPRERRRRRRFQLVSSCARSTTPPE